MQPAALVKPDLQYNPYLFFFLHAPFNPDQMTFRSVDKGLWGGWREGGREGGHDEFLDKEGKDKIRINRNFVKIVASVVKGWVVQEGIPGVPGVPGVPGTPTRTARHLTFIPFKVLRYRKWWMPHLFVSITWRNFDGTAVLQCSTKASVASFCRKDLYMMFEWSNILS